jgi:hypothetical protein
MSTLINGIPFAPSSHQCVLHYNEQISKWICEGDGKCHNDLKDPAAVKLGRRGGMAKATKPKGFAALSKKRRREISQLGGKARRKKK